MHNAPAHSISCRKQYDRRAQIGFFVCCTLSLCWTDFDIVCVVCLLSLVLSGVRVLISLAVVQCFMLSYTPYCIPLSLFSLGAFVWLWRSDLSVVSSVQSVMLQSAAIGFAMCWSISGFVVPAIDGYGLVIQSIICGIFSLQYIAIGVATHLTRVVVWWQAQLIVSICALAFEFFEAYLGVSWSASNILLSVAYTPIAQWSNVLTPFGLIGAIYWVGFGFYCLFDKRLERILHLVFPSSVLFALLWIGGIVISLSECAPLGLSVALVQPHVHHRMGSEWRPWELLDRLTFENHKSKPAVDLVVWPETSIPESWAPGEVEETTENFGLNDMRHRAKNRYASNLIAGCVIREKGLEKQRAVNRYNCACLFTKEGQLAIHRKLILVPLREGLPVMLRSDWVRGAIQKWFGMNALFSAGEQFRYFDIETKDGSNCLILPVVCYESWHPWLPQFSKQAISPRVYILYDGDFFSRPELVQRQIQGISLRSIETRSWSLVCSTWAGTCVIDPNGKIVQKAPPCEFVLRTDAPIKATR